MQLLEHGWDLNQQRLDCDEMMLIRSRCSRLEVMSRRKMMERFV